MSGDFLKSTTSSDSFEPQSSKTSSDSEKSQRSRTPKTSKEPPKPRTPTLSRASMMLRKINTNTGSERNLKIFKASDQTSLIAKAQEAIKNNNISDLRELLKSGLSKNVRVPFIPDDYDEFNQLFPNEHEAPLIYFAIKAKNNGIIRLLADSKIEPSEKLSLIKTAIVVGDFKIIKSLIKKLKKTDKKTVAKEKYQDLKNPFGTEKQLEKENDLHTKNNVNKNINFNKLLKFAVKISTTSDETIRYLLDQGAKVKKVFKYIENGSLTPRPIFFDYAIGIDVKKLKNCLKCESTDTKINLYGMSCNGEPITQEMLLKKKYPAEKFITSLAQIDELPKGSKQKQRILNKLKQFPNNDGNFVPLYKVVEVGSKVRTLKYLQEKADPNQRHNKQTLLQIAVANNDIDIALMLLEYGAVYHWLKYLNEEQLKNFKEKFHKEITNALPQALKVKNLSLVKGLLFLGADVNIESKSSCLSLAVKMGEKDVVDKILSRLQKESEWDWQPMVIAAKNGHLGILKILSNHGADLKKIDPNTGNNLFHIVCKALPHNTHKIVQFLKKKDVKHDLENNSAKKPHHILLGQDPEVIFNHEFDKKLKDHSPIKEKNYIEALANLIEIKDALEWSILNKSNNALLLLQFGANLDSIDKSVRDKLKLKPKKLNYLLHMAIQNKELHYVKQLLKLGADINSIYKMGFSFGYSCLALAVKSKKYEMVKVVLESSFERVDDWDEAPLFSAVKTGCFEILKLLADYDASLEIMQDGNTLLHALCELQPKQTIKILKYLIEKKVDPQIRNHEGKTALDILIQGNGLKEKKYKVCLKLLSHKSDDTETPSRSSETQHLTQAIESANTLALEFLRKDKDLPVIDITGSKTKQRSVLTKKSVRQALVRSNSQSLNHFASEIKDNPELAKAMLLDSISEKNWRLSLVKLFLESGNYFDTKIDRKSNNTFLNLLLEELPDNTLEILKTIQAHLKGPRKLKLNENEEGVLSINFLIDKIVQITTNIDILKTTIQSEKEAEKTTIQSEKEVAKTKKQIEIEELKLSSNQKELKHYLNILNILLSIIKKKSLKTNFSSCYNHWNITVLESFFKNGIKPNCIVNKAEKNTLFHLVMIEKPSNILEILKFLFMKMEEMKQKVIKGNKYNLTPRSIVTQKVQELSKQLIDKSAKDKSAKEEEQPEEIDEKSRAIENEIEDYMNILEFYNNHHPKEKRINHRTQPKIKNLLKKKKTEKIED